MLAIPSTRSYSASTPASSVTDLSDMHPIDVPDTSTPPSPSSPSSPLPLPATLRDAARESSLATLGETFNVELARAGRGKSKWPLYYVADMAAGFAAVKHLQDTKSLSLSDAFQATFQCDFKKTTWNDNYRIWEASRAVPGERERWIALGSADEGRWSEFAKKWRAQVKRRKA